MNHIYIATSLDGFIARSDGSLDWLLNLDRDPDNDYGFEGFLEGIDVLVMGRKTFETVEGFESWPFNKPVFVLSTILQELPEKLHGKVEILMGDPKDIVSDLKSRGFENLYIDGGQTIQRFLKEDLIDKMIITTVPIILGDGIPLFKQLKGDIRFKCIDVELLNHYLVKHYYVRDK